MEFRRVLFRSWVYGSGIHVPLIIRWPDANRGGEVSGQLVSFVDFAPTMLSLLGVQIPEHMQGRAFLGPQKRAFFASCCTQSASRHTGMRWTAG